MANAVKNAIVQKKIEGTVYDLMIKTNAANVVVDSTGKTLAAALAEIIASLADAVTIEAMDERIHALVNGAPAAYDTLKELADYISAHETVTEALHAAIGNKVDKAAGKGLSTEDFTTALKTKLEGLAAYTHPASHPASMITETADKRFCSDSEKAAWNEKGRILTGTTTPADLRETDLFLQIIK